ncbi:MAG: hypothetical protein C0625_13415 [Arcobacter sp.]|mgnify:CR=1 FL=1|nr:MAG: hypothetical protein C0625_13415 [Arcobacter sp.]
MNKYFLILLLPYFIFAKPVINSKIEHYDIYPESKNDLRRALFAKTPIIINGKKYLGVTRWEIYLEYEILKKKHTCEALNLKTIANIIIILPNISKEQKVSYNTKSSFRRFYNKVKKHEQKHKQYIISATKKIDKKIQRIRIQSNCEKLKMRFERNLKKIITKYNKKNEIFDIKAKKEHNPNSDLDSYL